MIDNERFVEFLNYLISEKKVRNQQEFVENIGSNKATVSQIKTGKISIPNDLFAKIQSAYPELNIDWLKTGEGKMLLDEMGQRLIKYTSTAKSDGELLAKSISWLIFSMYEKQNGHDFSFDGFAKLTELFKVAATYTDVLQSSLDAALTADALTNIKNSPQFDNEGGYILPESLTKPIDKYAELYKSLKEIADDLTCILHKSMFQEEMIEYIKNNIQSLSNLKG
jgi:transcriptional regulator with XRE-family HTH domain